MGRKASCDKQDVNKGAWSSEEDQILMNYVRVHGEGKWREVSKRAGLKRCGKSCRLRWLNYLKPDIKRGNISSDEEDLIIRLHNLLGNRWSLIAGRLPGRTDNEIKNYWNTYLRKKVEQKPNHNKLPGHSNKIPIKLRVESPGDSKNNSLAIIDPTTTKSPHPMIKPKSVRCTKIMMPTNDSVNTINLITTSWDGKNLSASTPQDIDRDCSSAAFLKDFAGISDMLIPYEDCHFNRYANCVEIPQQFGDEAIKFDSIGEAWYENWKTDGDYFQPEQVVDFFHFQNFGHD